MISDKMQSIYYSPTQHSGLSGGWATYTDTEEEKDLEIIRKYAKALEIGNRVVKIIKYAKKHKLDIHDTLESFFDKDDIKLHENVDKLKVMVDNIKGRKKREKKLEKLDNLAKDRMAIPWQSLASTTGKEFNELEYIKQLANNSNNLHLTS